MTLYQIYGTIVTNYCKIRGIEILKSKEEFKKHLGDSEFLKLFAGATSPDEVASIAQKQGYDVTPEDVENTTLSDDILESVAGGKNDVYQYEIVINNSGGNTNNLGNQSSHR